MQPKYGLATMCDQNCGIQSVNRQTDKQTDNQIDRQKSTTRGRKILLNDFFYFQTVIIGGLRSRHTYKTVGKSTRQLTNSQDS